MNPDEFPSLGESVNNTENSNLGASWAKVAQPEQKEDKEKHRPGAWENEQDASYADIAGHEKKLTEEYPSLQEAVSDSTPTSSGVSDLLNKSESSATTESTQPPNPDKSFADATSNKGYPLPKHDESIQSDGLPPLSDLPDVKDMLKQPSVKPPPPPQSFAKMAAKEIPPEERPLSDRAQKIIREQEKKEEEKPYVVNDENFPTLGQSNLMATHQAKEDEKEVYTEISKLNQTGDIVEEDDRVVVDKKKDEAKKSFADIAASNLENAPPSAKSRIDKIPVYDEDTVLLEERKREERKEHPVEYGNNDELIEQEQAHEEKEKANVTKKEIREKEEGRERKDRSMGENDERPKDALDARLQVFDKTHSGRITIFDTLFALYRLGYPLLTILPAAYLMHIRLSPLSSPYSFPFIYRSLFDLISLPIYTKNLSYALTYKTPMLHQPKDQVIRMVKEYGSNKDGLGYWDGIRAIGHNERLRWWQLSRWAVHRIQWTLTYAMLYDPSNHIVTTPTLISLNQAIHHHQ
ncbi:hypothetical protein G6F37_010379 [Rhizopus arrhizus]|nr:hypothetical protein G6F38_010882 [Rhizopus arrhizus]KAG1153414.1 hypothetical protein G6F37_010379 [Rhizopus arrhizus]